MEKQKRKSSSLKDKYESHIIQNIENGVTQTDICCEINLPKSTTSVPLKKGRDFINV